MRHVEATPTWSALLPMMLMVLEDGTEAGKREIRAELARMATAADRWAAVADTIAEVVR